METARAKVREERGVFENPGRTVKYPRVAMNLSRYKEAIRKPALDNKENIACEINLYGP
jgi:hypothetical protein